MAAKTADPVKRLGLLEPWCLETGTPGSEGAGLCQHDPAIRPVARDRHPVRQSRSLLRSGRGPRTTPDVGVKADEPTQSMSSSASSSMLSYPEWNSAEKLG